MKILIIRFSSIGDLTQALSLPAFIKSYHPNAEIHFVTRSDLASLVENHPDVKRLWSLDRQQGFKGLWQLISELRTQNFTHIYDAHNNLRSFFIRTFVPARFKHVRPMMRLKRFMLLNFHVNRFEMPFSGQRDLIKPLEKWGMAFKLPPPPQLFLSATQPATPRLPEKFVALVPSAAYELKRWPLEYWCELVEKNPNTSFVVLAGPQDSFTKKLSAYANVLNLTRQTDLLQSAAVLQKSELVVANDTGLLHFAEQLGKPTIALMGPAVFGFPSRAATLILERHLKCRPCSKHGQGPCVNSKFHECLRDISVNEVSTHMKRMLSVTP